MIVLDATISEELTYFEATNVLVDEFLCCNTIVFKSDVFEFFQGWLKNWYHWDILQDHVCSPCSYVLFLFI